MSGNILTKQNPNKINPCGSTSDVYGTVSILPAQVADSTFFDPYSVLVDGTYEYAEYRSYVSVNLRASLYHQMTFTYEQFPDLQGPFYLTTCGSVVFADGKHPRYSGPYQAGASVNLPPLVAFLDYGKWSSEMTYPLPPTKAPCPPPLNPVYSYNLESYASVEFEAIGQNAEYDACLGYPYPVTASSEATSVVTVHPRKFSTITGISCPTYLEPNTMPTDHATITAAGLGGTFIDNRIGASGSFGDNQAAEFVIASPSPAPVPTYPPN